MTGFGAASVSLSAGQVWVRVRAVNHRFVDSRLRLPSALSVHHHKLEQFARKQIERGRVEVAVELRQVPTGKVSLDRDRAADALAQLQQLQNEVAPGSPVPFALLVAVPDLFVNSDAQDESEMEKAVFEALRQAFDQLNAMRFEEGSNLAQDLQARSGRIRQLTTSIKASAKTAPQEQAERLRVRVRELLNSGSTHVGRSEGAPDSGRMELEIALLADRMDVSEELTRLTSHCDQFENLMLQSAPVGRRLDFLVQEMHREANTIGSKSGETETTHLVVELKSEIERVREQVQNIL